MIGCAPAALAPMIALNPTPPSPNTATDVPAATRAVFTTAPTPVITAQPNSTAVSIGMSRSIRTTDSRATTVNSE